MPRTNALEQIENLEELLDRLGGISPRRVRIHPPLGTATEKDLTAILDRTNIICELIDGVLVEKIHSFPESCLTIDIARLLWHYLDQHDLGNLAGPDGTMRLRPALVRAPDLSFVRWEKLPGRRPPVDPTPDLVPDLAVEVLSEGNTPGEMALKRRDFFLSGVELVWMVDPKPRTVTVYPALDKATVFTEADTLDGGKVLPGLSLPVRRIFVRTPIVESAPAKKKRSSSSRKRKTGDNS